METNQNELVQIRIDKLKKLQSEGKDPFKNESFDFTHYSTDITEKFAELEGKEVALAGRIVLFREHGKASFATIQDYKGRAQIYVRQDKIGEEEYKDFSDFDMGDIIGVHGTVFKTQKGEISVRADKVVLLTKSLHPLPDKHAGLKDQDMRYRQRYVDLIVNPEVKEAFLIRNKAIKAMRDYLDERGFVEMDTPILNTIAGGANARPFVTHHNTLDIDMYLRIANELYLKRLIVGGFEKVYEIGRMFRNEGMSIKHNPEYTAMELYWAYVDYKSIMEITENIISHMAIAATGSPVVNYQGKEIDFTPPWRRVSMIDAVKQYTGVDFNEINTDEEAIAIAKEKGIELTPATMTRGHIISLMFEEFCEEHLEQPTFVTHHPVEISPLSKRNPDDPRLTNRFEAFANTWELANAFSELNDPIDQRGRFEAQMLQKELGDDEAHEMDEDFLRAIEVGLPPTGGLGIGIDRVIMLLTNSSTIRDVIPFPTMKPIHSTQQEEEE